MNQEKLAKISEAQAELIRAVEAFETGHEVKGTLIVDEQVDELSEIVSEFREEYVNE